MLQHFLAEPEELESGSFFGLLVVFVEFYRRLFKSVNKKASKRALLLESSARLEAFEICSRSV